MSKFDKLAVCGDSTQTRVSERNPILESFLFSSNSIMQYEYAKYQCWFVPKGSEINVFASNLDVIVNAEQVVRGAAQAQQRNQEQASRGGATET